VAADQQKLILYVRFEVLLAMKMLIAVFWVVMPCGLVGDCQHFAGMFVITYKIIQCHNPEDHDALWFFTIGMQ
jgi:hypothetical protein